MTLVFASVSAGVLLLAAGALLLLYPGAVRRGLRAFPRHRGTTLALLSGATAIVLYNVTQLGEADFGKYRHLLFVFFLALAVGAWFRVPDFLGIRALAVLGLLLAGVYLRAAYLEPPAARLFLVVASYALVLVSLYLAAVPYRFRDAVDRLDRSKALRRGVGAAGAAYGLLLCLVPVTF